MAIKAIERVVNAPLALIDNIGASIKAAPVFSGYGGYGYGSGSTYGGYSNGTMLESSLPGAQYDYRTAAGALWENPAAAACLIALMDAFAQARVHLKHKEGDEWATVFEHDLVGLLNNPNGGYSAKHHFGVTLCALFGVHSAFWQIVGSKSGAPVELWFKPPAGLGHEGIAPMWNSKEFISGYCLWVDSKPNYLKKDEVVYFRRALDIRNPRLPWNMLGLGSREIATLNNAATFTASLLRNGATPSTLVTPDGDGGPAPDQMKDIKLQMQQGFTGENVGKIATINQRVKVQPFGFTPEQLALDRIQSWPQEVVCALLRTPSTVALLPSGQNHQTYENVDAFTRWWWWNTIIPMQEAFGDEIEAQMFGRYGLDTAEWQIGWDYSNVKALEEDQNAKDEKTASLYRAGAITLEQAQIRQGKKAEDWMKRAYHPSAVPTLVGENGQAMQASGQEAEGSQQSGAPSLPWEDADSEKLQQLYESGTSNAEILEAFPDRNEGEIISQLAQLGLIEGKSYFLGQAKTLTTNQPFKFDLIRIDPPTGTTWTTAIGDASKAITADSRRQGSGIPNEAGTYHIENGHRVRGARVDEPGADASTLPTAIPSPEQRKRRAGIAGRDYRKILPRTGGKWNPPDAPGNGHWIPDNPQARQICGDGGIPFRDGFPNFRQHEAKLKGTGGKVRRARVVMEFTGDRTKDFAIADSEYARMLGLKSAAQVARMRKEGSLTWHHEPDCQKQRMVLVPFVLHDAVPHSGGHSRCRTGGEAKSWGWLKTWNEDDHPRDRDGKFGHGGSASNSVAVGAIGHTIEQAEKVIAHYAKNEKIEVGYLIDNDTGKAVDFQTGDAGSVGVNLDILFSHDNLTQMHNHPMAAGFSDNDLKITLKSSALREMVVIDNAGTRYHLQKPDGWSWDQNLKKNGSLNDAWEKLENAAFENPKYKAMWDVPDLKFDDTVAEMSHDIIVQLSKDWGFIYTREKHA